MSLFFPTFRHAHTSSAPITSDRRHTHTLSGRTHTTVWSAVGAGVEGRVPILGRSSDFAFGARKGYAAFRTTTILLLPSCPALINVARISARRRYRSAARTADLTGTFTVAQQAWDYYSVRNVAPGPMRESAPPRDHVKRVPDRASLCLCIMCG